MPPKRPLTGAAATAAKAKVQKLAQQASASEALRAQENIPAQRRPTPKAKAKVTVTVTPQSAGQVLNPMRNDPAPAPLRTSVRQNRGQNGHLDKMAAFVEKTTAPTPRTMVSTGALIIPSTLAENAMAPPPKPSRTRTNNVPAAVVQALPSVARAVPTMALATAEGRFGFVADASQRNLAAGMVNTPSRGAPTNPASVVQYGHFQGDVISAPRHQTNLNQGANVILETYDRQDDLQPNNAEDSITDLASGGLNNEDGEADIEKEYDALNEDHDLEDNDEENTFSDDVYGFEEEEDRCSQIQAFEEEEFMDPCIDADEDDVNDVENHNVMGIDETSPEADERCALENLHRYSSPAGQVVNITAAHRKRNRAVRPPKPSRLRQSTYDDMEEPVTDDQAISQRAARNSKTKDSGCKVDPTKLAFYGQNPTLKAIIMATMDKYRLHVALINPFPSTDNGFDDAQQLIVDKIATAILAGELPNTLENEATRDMGELIFAVGASQRSSWKKVGRTVVSTWYKDHLFPPASVSPLDQPNQFTPHARVQANVKALLDESVFIHGGQDNERDDEGLYNNFGHPAIKRMIIDMYYSPSKALVRLAPNDFKDMVPLPAAALAMTIIQNCLEEYQEDGKQKNKDLKGEDYSTDYDKYLSAMEEVGKDRVHGAKLRRLQRDWAQDGLANMKRRLNTSQCPIQTSKLPFRLD